MNKQLLEKLVSHLKCRRCGQRCESANARWLGYGGPMWLFSAYCPHCKSEGLAVAPMTKGELPQSAAHLAQPEIRRVPAGVITDDVADMHTFLKDFRGDFCSLFSKD